MNLGIFLIAVLLAAILILVTLHRRSHPARAVLANDSFFSRPLGESRDVSIAPDESRAGLSVGMLTLLGVGSVIGTGIFVITGYAAQQAGPGMIVSFASAGIASLAVAACYAELTKRVAGAGGAYSFARVAFGPATGMIAGYILLAAFLTNVAAVAVGWSAYLASAASNWGVPIQGPWTAGPSRGGIIDLPAMGLILVITGLLAAGSGHALRLNAAIVGIKLAVFVPFALLVFEHFTPTGFTPFMPRGLLADGRNAGVIGAAITLFWAFTGYEVIANASDESRDPETGPGRALLFTVLICMLLYMVVAVGVVSVLDAQPMANESGYLAPGSAELANACSGADFTMLTCTREPVSSVFRRLGSPVLASFGSLIAWATLPSLVIGVLFALSRVVRAMADEGALPAMIADGMTHAYGQRRAAVVAGSVAAIIAGVAPIGMIADASNGLMVAIIALVALALLVLRWRSGKASIGHGFGGYIYAVVAIGAAALLANTMDISSWTLLGVIVAIGVVRANAVRSS